MGNGLNITVPNDNKALVYFSERHVVSKDDTITVPKDYVGLIYIEGRPKTKILPCSNENLVKKYGKELKNTEIQVAFYSEKTRFEVKWGIGGIQVNNDRLDDAYSVGINGRLYCTFSDPTRFINFFATESSITDKDVWQKVLPTIVTDGVPVLSQYFSGKNVSIFEINSELNSIREKMSALIKDERIFKDMGLNIEDVTLNQIYVPEEELQRIKERING